ncbi:MAG: molybdenum cofactor biosynthesis protein B [Deltaproteobacteria bacterium]|nr:molybdenum cofactor biosynthesis protein B [Deltaproteobacteria bacterium]MCW5800945.1 molybdenum cofactor biosynthesis protein B [Deltaproteobacteria bacterium]
MEREFIPVNVAVLTVSDTRTIDTDTSGALIADRLTEVGHRIAARAIVVDSELHIRAQLAAWIADPGVDVVIATGGTGVTPRDVTPEALAPLVTKPIPGFGELFRWLSFEEIGTSTIQSRAEAALCGATYVFLLPGSTGGVRLGLEKILIPQLDHRLKPCNFVMLLPRIRHEPTGRA